MRGDRRTKAVALLALGALIGVLLGGTPAGAHVGGTVSHLWNQHIKPKTDKRYYKKAQVNKRAGRAVVAQQAGEPAPATFTTIVEVDIRVPKKGFVLVTGTARLDGGTTCPCEAGMRLYDGTNASFVYRLHNEATTDSDSTTISYVFPASKGLHTYAVQLDERMGDTAGGTADATITALYVPFNGTGGTTFARPAAASVQRGG